MFTTFCRAFFTSFVTVMLSGAMLCLYIFMFISFNCLGLLTCKEDPDQFDACLQAAEKLIRDHSVQAKEVHFSRKTSFKTSLYVLI